MSGRATQILRRFPAHLEARRAGKRLGVVTEALARDLDTLSAAVARVRRARRVLEADELLDLLRIGALHGIRRAELAVLFQRFELARELVLAARESDAAAEQLLALWGTASTAPRLPLYASRASAVEFAERALDSRALLEAVRRRVVVTCANHARGNGTIRSLLTGAANALDLDVSSVEHSHDRYLHLALVEDRLRLLQPAAEPGGVERELTPATERLLLEENPLTPAKTGDVARQHGECFSVLRRGFERETLRVIVAGVEGRTHGPMLVNRDEGHGVGFIGSVPNGSTLDFSEEGRVLLDGADVTALSYAWKGACFTDVASPESVAFVFDGPGYEGARAARFAESTPAGALGAGFAFPHSGDGLPMPGIAVGETHFAFLVQEAHFSAASSAEPPQGEGDPSEATTTVTRVEPRPAVGFADGSVFAPGPHEARGTAAVVTLAWHERTAFWVNVWIPPRFVSFTPDDPEGRATLEHVAFALNRSRPAGVHVEVKFLDERWVLGRGWLPAEETPGGGIAGPGAGTELWSAPTE